MYLWVAGILGLICLAGGIAALHSRNKRRGMLALGITLLLIFSAFALYAALTLFFIRAV